MNFMSRALWSGAAFGREGAKYFLTAAGFSIFPNIMTEGLFFVLLILGIGGMPGWEGGHPDIMDYPIFAQILYNITHSLIVFALLFAILRILAVEVIVAAAGWGLHILIDIPTHSLSLFPTPFLWPLSDFKFDGIGWDNPVILAVDIVSLICIYSFWLFPRYYRLRKND